MPSQIVNVGETTTFSKLIATSNDGIRLQGDATVYDDLLTGAESARAGAVAPTIAAGFRGDNKVLRTSFVSSQADELQFSVQFPHGWAEGTKFFPHVHFAPEAAGAANNAAQFILGYRFANVGSEFPADESVYTMTSTWTGDKRWYHYIAGNATGITIPTGKLSAVMKCRVYRDNTVTNNLAGNVTVLYFDWHVEKDALGSGMEYTK
jgi:prepilin-type processing-associated H-X9-DG protein